MTETNSVMPNLNISIKRVEDLIPSARNARTHSKTQIEKLAALIREFGFINPIIEDGAGNVLAGHGRLEAAKLIGLAEVPTLNASHLTAPQRRAFMLADNRSALDAGWDEQMLADELKALMAEDFRMDLTGFDSDELSRLLNESEDISASGSLAEKFLIPPFSVLNAREGWWQDRKRAWLALGLRSELGRGDNLLKFSDAMNNGGYGKAFGAEGNISGATGTSIFDPVLCEIAYRWFSPEGGTIIDPFAGGSVRGIVAAKLGRKYIGVDLRAEQVEANTQQGAALCGDASPAWHAADSLTIDSVCAGVQADFIFSCPPYADLEVYSDNPADLSTMDYANFRAAYFEIIKKTCALLKNDRFACFVVGEVRDKKGNYYDFVGDTVQAFRDGGLNFYNEAILVTSAGSLPLRAGKQFVGSRKLGKTHQNILVFVKGDGKAAAAACGPVEIHFPEGTDEAENGENL